LAEAGAAVVVNYASSKSCAESVVNRYSGKRAGKPWPCRPICPSSTTFADCFAETKKAFGKLDVLVNNAGIYEFAPLEAISAEHFHKQFDLNVLGLLGDAGSRQAFRSRRRQHRQHQFGGRHGGAADRRRL